MSIRCAHCKDRHASVNEVRECSQPKPEVITVPAPPADLPYLTDRYGFPIENCTRCDGEGRLEMYRHVMGGLCAKCNGLKTSYPKGKAGDAAREFYKILKARKTAVRGNIVAGDVVAVEGKWRTVAAVRPTFQWTGSMWTGVEGTPTYGRIDYYAELIQFTDGTEEINDGFTWKRKAGITVDDAHTASAAARALYEVTLKRRKK